MAAPGAPRAPTQTLPGCRKAQGQGEQAAWGATSGSLTHSPRPGSTKGMGGWSGPPSTKGTGMASGCPGMGQQQPPHAPVPQGGDALWHPSLVGDTVAMPCAFEERGVAM